ncbi:uncharacterized protein LOC142767774 [Rhipicephalus microplus]|uniref:uncharacterized protein LOC142767774 n=1 Tax=Rhipicephalus microplus TaxID=6941 RepID=UPI003F6CA930
MFRHAVHEIRSLLNIEQFHYLKSLVTGEALKAIDGIQATEQSYEYAITLLKDHFGNKKIIEQQYLASLRTLKPVKSSSEVASLRHLLHTVHNNIAGLNAFGCSGLYCATTLIEDLAKVIEDTLVEYFKQQSRLTNIEVVATSEMELRDLLDYERTEVKARERIAFVDVASRGVREHRQVAAATEVVGVETVAVPVPVAANVPPLVLLPTTVAAAPWVAVSWQGDF